MDFKKPTAECLKFTDDIIKEFGPRQAGTRSCKHAAAEIRERLARYCDEAVIEPFEYHDGAFLGFMRFIAVGFCILSACALLGGYFLIPAMIAYIVCWVAAVGEFVMYREVLDRFYRKAPGFNVSGRLEPSGKVRRQVIISGHHDSSRVFNFLVRFQKWYTIRIMGGLLCFGITGLLVFIWGIYFLAGVKEPAYTEYLGYGLFLNFLAAIQFFFFLGKQAVPGAGDNLIATAVCWQLAKIFHAARKNKSPLQSTRLIFLSTDAEEQGLRGARAWVREHREELLSVPTFAINIDSLYELRELKCLTSEVNGFVKTSRDLALECQRIAARLGLPLSTSPMAFGGGATDAAEFAQAGVEATTFIGLSTHYFRDGLAYHTMNDTVDRIEPAVVETVLNIIYEFIMDRDREE